MSSVRALMNIAAQEDCVVHQMDVKTAYLNADIDCEVYVEQPLGFVQKGKNGEDLVCKLNKSLYGLKQSGRNWCKLLHNFLIDQNFKQSLCDNCVYFKHENNLKTIIIVWVDDIIVCGSNLDCVNIIKDSLSARFKMKDFGMISWLLGIEFIVKPNDIEMNQSKYIEKMLSKFKLADCYAKPIPCDLGIDKLGNNNNSQELADQSLYREIVGSLIYLMTTTRPEICYSVTRLSQYLSKPTLAHLNSAKYVLKYLKGTINHGLKFIKSNSSLNLIGFSDSDWGGSQDRRSISGHCFRLSTNSSMISWKSKKQSTVALSSCEAEYIALTHAIQEASFLRQLLADMQGTNKTSADIFVDNQGAINLAKNPVHHQRTKHIDIKYHYIRSHVQDKNIIITYVPSADNIADMFTKPVNKFNLKKFNICS